jgi:SAM-dependent methyltransferase
MADGRKLSPFALVRVNFEADPPPQGTLNYRIQIIEQNAETQYQTYKKVRATNLFGAHADAKVIQVARMIRDAVPKAIDVGAGTGRNAVELARRGFAVDAVEVVSEMCGEIQNAAAAAKVSINVIDADFIDMVPPASNYQLAVLSEVATQLDESEVEIAFKKVAEMLAPGGFFLVNLFLAADGFRPDPAMREFSLCSLCRVYTRAELKSLVEGLPFKWISDESAFEFEREHLPPEAWPPTTWFESWALGSNLFDMPTGTSPFELRWLLYQRQ